MMAATFQAAILCLAVIVRVSETAPVIMGGNTQSFNVAENAAASDTVFTLTSNTAAEYTLGGTDASAFTAAPTTSAGHSTTGTITINASPVFATKSSYSFTVIATAADNSATTVTVTVNVIKTPAYLTIVACDGLTAGGEVATLLADGHTGSTLAYSINSGNAAGDFAYGASTGALTVATGKTLASATTASYTLELYAVDATTTPGQTASTTVTVSVTGTCTGSGSGAITGGLTAVLCMIFLIFQKLA